MQSAQRPRVGLFVTCLIDLFRPSIGFAAVELLERAGCAVEVPEQTCCGQPAYNSGDVDDSRALARQTVEAFEDFDYLIAPSGSCAAQIRTYPRLFPEGSELHRRARHIAERTYELTAFLSDIMDFGAPFGVCRRRATYHDSCSGLRQLGIREQPRRLLAAVEGLELTEMAERNVCCGFGGTFCVKYPEISTRMVTDKCDRIRETDAELLIGGDLGCLMNIAGRLSRQGSAVHTFHVAEVLAGMTDATAIGKAD